MHICSTRSPIAKSSFSSILLLHRGSEVFRNTSTRQFHFSSARLSVEWQWSPWRTNPPRDHNSLPTAYSLVITSVARDDRRSYHHDCHHDYHQSHHARLKSP